MEHLVNISSVEKDGAKRDGFFMARALRIEYEGAFYQVTSRGNERRDVLVDEQDRLF